MLLCAPPQAENPPPEIKNLVWFKTKMNLNYVAELIATKLDVGIDEIKLAIALILTIPFAFVHRRMKDVQIKHIYSLFIGASLAYWMYGRRFFLLRVRLQDGTACITLVLPR